MKGQIFISYSTKDTTIAKQIVEYLESTGETCWIAPRNIPPGRDYTDVINEAITDCKAVVVIISKKSVQSQWVKKELTTATSLNKLIVPFKISQVDLSGGWLFLMNNVQWIDAKQDTTSKFPEITEGINHILTVKPKATTQNKFQTKRKIVPIVTSAVVVILLILIISTLINRHGETDQITADTTIEKQEQLFVQEIEAVDTRMPNPSSKNTNTINIQTQRDMPQSDSHIEEVPETQTTKESLSEVEEHIVDNPKITELPTETTPARKNPSVEDLAFKKKLSLAKRAYDDHDYKKALDLYQELASKKPNDKEIATFITECKQHLAE